MVGTYRFEEDFEFDGELDFDELEEFADEFGRFGSPPPRGKCGPLLSDGTRLYTLKPGDSLNGVTRRIYNKTQAYNGRELETLKSFRKRFRLVNAGTRFWPGKVFKIPTLKAVLRTKRGLFRGFAPVSPIC